MPQLGKLLIIFGVILVGAGVVLMLIARTNLPLGRLPGDFLYRNKHTTIYFPFATSLLLSVILSLLLYVLNHFRK